MYDPKVGRWLSEDPIGFADDDGNLYRYVGNEPTVVTDSSGLSGQRVGRGFVHGAITGAKLMTTVQGYSPIHVVYASPETGVGRVMPPAIGLTGNDLGALMSQLFAVINPNPPKCERLAVLELRGHAHGGRGVSIGQGSDEHTTESDSLNFMTENNASFVGRRLHYSELLAPQSVIILDSCNVGNKKQPPDVASLLAHGSGSLVIAAGGFSEGSFGAGNVATTATYDDPYDPTDKEETFYQVKIRQGVRNIARTHYDSQNDTWYFTR